MDDLSGTYRLFRTSAGTRQGPEGHAVMLFEFAGITLHQGRATPGLGLLTARPLSKDFLRRYRDLWATVNASTGLAGSC